MGLLHAADASRAVSRHITTGRSLRPTSASFSARASPSGDEKAILPQHGQRKCARCYRAEIRILKPPRYLSLPAPPGGIPVQNRALAFLSSKESRREHLAQKECAEAGFTFPSGADDSTRETDDASIRRKDENSHPDSP